MGRPGTYWGLMIKNQADGFGRFIAADKIFHGSIFEAQFVEGEVQGFVRIIWNDGGYRTGVFKDNEWVSYQAYKKDDTLYEELEEGGKVTKY